MSREMHIDTPVTVVHEAQNALTATRQRLHHLRQNLEHGDIDIASILSDLSHIDGYLKQSIDFVSALQVGLIYADDAAVRQWSAH